MLGFKSSAPGSGMSDDLGHVTLPSVPSVCSPVNIPLTPVKTQHSSFLTRWRPAVITPSERDRERHALAHAERDGESGEESRREGRERGIQRGQEREWPFLQQPIFMSWYCYQCITPSMATTATITPLNWQSIIIGQRGALTLTSYGALGCNWLHS